MEIEIKIEVSVRDEMRVEVSRILLIFKCKGRIKNDDDNRITMDYLLMLWIFSLANLNVILP